MCSRAEPRALVDVCTPLGHDLVFGHRCRLKTPVLEGLKTRLVDDVARGSKDPGPSALDVGCTEHDLLSPIGGSAAERQAEYDAGDESSHTHERSLSPWRGGAVG